MSGLAHLTVVGLRLWLKTSEGMWWYMLLRRGFRIVSALFLTGNVTLAQVGASPRSENASANTVRYDLKLNEVKYVYGIGTPVLRLKAGDILETNTADGDGKVLEMAGIKAGGPNPLTGPFYIDGAQPGDILAVQFLSVEVNALEGFGSAAPGFGAINGTHYTPMLGGPIPTESWTYKIDSANQVAIFQANDSNFSTKIPLHPFLGCVGVAPSHGESRSAIVTAEFGGNMDASEAAAGNTLYLPVNVPGALLYLGDGHAAMGDGEVDGTAIEIQMKVRLKLDVIKGKHINWPRFENADYIMAAGIYRPLDDSLRIALTELVKWMHDDYGFSEMDAYELLSKVAEIHLDQMVDPNYTVVAKINKKFLPPLKSK
jgi:amidase